MKQYMDYVMEQLHNLIVIDSPSGFTDKVADYLLEEYNRIGYQPVKTTKGGVLVDLGGEGNAMMLMAHVDTLGAMVAEVKSDGRIRLTNIGGLRAENTEAENCRIYARNGKVYEGTIQLINASVHVNEKFNETARDFETVELVLDEPVTSKEDVKALGIGVGCYVCPEPRLRVTDSGYIKSRYLDDKLSTAILLGYAYYLKKENVKPERKIYQHITVYEEVGHGGAASIPVDVVEAISVDMGCVGKGLECTEREVSICVKDSRGPYSYSIVQKLIQIAEDNKIAYAADVYPRYGSDVDVALAAGVDAKHGLIGPGVYASHGYERSHKDGVLATLQLLQKYLG